MSVERHRRRWSGPPQLPQFFCLVRSTGNTGIASCVEFAAVGPELQIAACGDSCGLSVAIGQVVTQLPEKVITLNAQVADQAGCAEAVRAINNLATAQVRRDPPSLVDVKSLGRPKEFTGKEEDFRRSLLEW